MLPKDFEQRLFYGRIREMNFKIENETKKKAIFNHNFINYTFIGNVVFCSTQNTDTSCYISMYAHS